MDWELKTTSWDLTELARDAEPNLGSIVGFSSFVGPKKKGDCSVDLKLGRLGDFADRPLEKWKDSMVPSVASPPTGSSKRTRASGNGSNTVTCLVDGCKSDLSNCRDYHKRHKVCEVHAKTPMVLVGGQEQRFCQQCSRLGHGHVFSGSSVVNEEGLFGFHSLAEFDEVKRSCRKRLDGHNRRRRKPQPDSLSVNSRTLFSNHQATRFSSCISTPQMLSGSISGQQQPNWAASIKAEDDPLYGCHPPVFLDKQHPFPIPYARNYRGKQFPFLQSSSEAMLGHRTALETPGCQPLFSTIASSESSSSSGKIFATTADGLARVLDSDCALSLLSSSTRTSGISLGHVVQATERIPMAQPLAVGPQEYAVLGRYSCSQASNSISSTGFSCSGMEEEQMGAVLVSDASDAELHQGIFHMGGELRSTQNGPSASQTLPFCIMAGAASAPSGTLLKDTVEFGSLNPFLVYYARKQNKLAMCLSFT
ncbi:hypothetical protein ACLOJK_002025 [Asimina triloba]